MTTRISTVALLLCLSATAGCGNTSENQAPDASQPAGEDAAQQPPMCDPAKCNPGNICVQNQCMLQCTRHVDCPTSYECTEIEGKKVCAKAVLEAQFGKGMFGYSCGVNGDRDCATGFGCVGVAGDPDAYCAKKNCVSDTECPGNYYCQAIEQNGAAATKYCIKRSYCAPAQSILDCNDPDAVFARDTKGNGFCSRACNPDSPNSCGAGNGCYRTPSGGQCWPRQKTCIPERTFCGRCLSALDCPANAACYLDDFTKERYCVTQCGADKPCPSTSAGGVLAGCFRLTAYNNAPFCLPYEDGPRPQPSQCWLPCPDTGCE